MFKTRTLRFGRCLLSLLLLGLTLGCGGGNQDAQAPASADDANRAPASPHELDVEMTMEEKDEPVREADRSPPPTSSWKPVEKMGPEKGPPKK